VALGIVAILAVSYLVVVNVLLRTGLLRNAISGSSVTFALSGNSTALRLDYQSAYSIIPGRVHVEGLTIRGREQNEEWFLTLDRADVAVSLVDLLHRSFHATRVRASGFTIRARLRLDRADATPDVVAALPPIAGFADPPLLDEGPDSPPLTDANYNLWMVQLEDVDVEHVREVWIHTVRSVGDTRVRGRWVFRPQRWLDVGPATVDVNGVDFFYGSRPLASGLRGSALATVHPFDLRQVKGRAIFDHVSYDGQLGGRALIAGVLRLLAPRSGVSFRRWEGPFDARMVLDHGKFASGTQVTLQAADCEVEAKGLAFRAPIRNELGVAGDLATLYTRVSGLRVSRLGVEQARVASIAATVTSRHLELTHFFDDAHFTLDVGGAESKNVGAWQHSLPSTSDFVIRSGSVTADGHADGSLAKGRLRARLRLVARRLTVERGHDQFAADVTGDAQLLDVSLPGGWAVGAATVAADDMEVRLGRAMLAGKLAMHVDLRRGTWAKRTFDVSGSNLVLSGVSAASASSRVAILVVPSLTAVAPRLVLGPAGVDGQVSIDLPRAELVDLGRLRELLPLPADLDIEGGRGRAKLHADVELGSGAMRGNGEVVARGIRARVDSTQFFGDAACAVTARRAAGAAGVTDLSGSTLAIAHAGTGNAVLPEDGWWGNLALREATLRTSGGVRFAAKAHLTAKDASPATVLVSQNTGVPGWAANVFRMPVLDADAEVRFAPSSVEVRSLVARGGGTSLRAEYAKRDGREDGAVLMDLGWIGLGYDLADGATGLVLIGPKAWFGRKTATMHDAAAAAKGKADALDQLARYAAMPPGPRKDEAKVLAARCALEVRSCDGTSIENLLRTAADASERDTLSGIMYAPTVVAAAKGGTDGTTLDPLVIGSLAQALKAGGESTLDNIPSMARVTAANDSDAARGKVIAVSGRASPIRREGAYSVGTLTTDAGPVYFVTPFATHGVSETFARFRGVFVQRYASASQPHGQPPSLVLVGAFGPSIQELEVSRAAQEGRGAVAKARVGTLTEPPTTRSVRAINMK
jgi:hypothetical protein